MITGSTPISQFPTGTIDNVRAVFPLSVGMPTGAHTIRADLLQTAQFLSSQGLMISGSYSLLDSSYRPNDYISGLKLQWNSSGSMSVLSGRAMTESGQLYVVTGTISLTVSGIPSGTLANVYLTGNNTFEVSATAFSTPYLGTARSKSGDTSKRYLGSVKCDAGGYMYGFVHHTNGTMMYKLFPSASSPFRVLTLGTATTSTAVPLSNAVPSSASLAVLRLLNSSDQRMDVAEGTPVNANNRTGVISLSTSSTQNIQGCYTMGMDSSLQVWYLMAAAVGVGGGFIDILGYLFER